MKTHSKLLHYSCSTFSSLTQVCIWNTGHTHNVCNWGLTWVLCMLQSQSLSKDWQKIQWTEAEKWR